MLSSNKIGFSKDYCLILLCLAFLNGYYFAPSFNFYPAHDSMNWLTHYFYVFYNEYFTNGQLALWLPYDLGGTETDYYMAAVMSPAQFFAAFAGKLFAVRNALVVLKASMVVEELAFVTGMYMLSLRLFRHRKAVLFVSVGAVFTIFWGTNFGFNFRFYYLMPFVLLLFIRLFDTGSPKFLWAGAAVAVVSLFGNAPYYIPVYLLVYSVFLAVLFFSRRNEVRLCVRAFFSPSSAVSFLVFAAVAFVYADLLRHVFDFTAVYSTGRTAGGGVGLENFLAHGSLMKDGAAVAGSGLDAFWQFIYACPRTYDFTAYIGLAPIVFIVYALLHPDDDPQFRAVGVAGLVIALLSLGEISFVAPALYLFFPLLSFYRHITYLAVIAKVLLLVMAGFGLDRYLDRADSKETFTSPAFIAGVLAGLILIVDIFVFRGAFGYARDSGDIIGYRFHFVPLATLMVAAVCLLRTGVREKAAGLVVILYSFEIASYATALFLGMPVKEPPVRADASFDAANHAFQGERYDAETMYRLRPYMKNATDYASINRTPLQYGAFYADPCPSEVFKDSSVRVDSVSTSLSALFEARFGSDMVGSLIDRATSGDALKTVLNDRAFLRALGCGSPKLLVVANPRAAADLRQAATLVRSSKDLDVNPVIIGASGGTAGSGGAEGEKEKGPKAAQRPAAKTDKRDNDAWYRISFTQRIGSTDYPFWESSGDPAMWLKISSDRETVLEEYRLTADYEPNITDRMFADWTLKGSRDNKTWVTIDGRENESDWRPGEERSFKVARPAAFRFYRLDIERLNNYGTLMRLGSMKMNLRKATAPGSFEAAAFNAGLKARVMPVKKTEPFSRSSGGSVLSALLTSNNMSVVADADSDTAWLVYLDNYHPGWQATVNGRPEEVERANIAFKAVRLERGRNEVRFAFAGNHNTRLYSKFFFIFGILSSLYMMAVSASCIAGRPGFRVSPGVAALALAFFACLPLFVFDFGLHNDYSFLVADKPGSLTFTNILFGFRDENPHLIMVGRPINAFLMGLLAVTLSSVKDLTVMRFVSFLLTLASGWLTFTYLERRLSLKRFWAAAAAFGVFALPSSQVYVIWVTNLVPGSLTVLMVCASYLVFDRAAGGLSGPRAKAGTFLGAFALLFAAFLVYPPNALFFLVFTAAGIIFSRSGDWPATRRRAMIDVAFCSVTTVLYFAFVKFVLGPVSLRAYPEMRGLMIEPQRYAMSFSHDLVYKAHQFYDISMIAFAAWFHAQFDERVAYPVALIIIAGLSVALVRAVRNERGEGGVAAPLKRAVQMAAALSFISLLSISPVLAAKGSFISYRLVYPYAAIAALLAVRALEGLTESGAWRGRETAAKAAAAAMIVLAAALAGSNLYASSLSAKKELAFFREKIIGEMPWTTARLSIIKPPWGSSFVEPVIKHEFNYMASNYNDTPAVDVVVKKELGLSRTVGVAPLGQRLLMNDLYKDPYRKFRMDQSFRVMTVDDSDFVIDMNEITNSRVTGKYRPTLIVRDSTKRPDGAAPQRAAEDPGATVPLLAEEGYEGFNIVRFGKTFYGILQSEGAFDPEKVKGGGYSRLFTGGAPEEVRAQIDRLPKEGLKARSARFWRRIIERIWR